MHILHCLSALLGGFAKNNYELCYQRTQIWCWYEFYYYSQWWKGHQKTVSSLDSTWLFPLLGSCYQASQDSEMCMKWQQKSLLLHRSLSVDMPQASRCTKPLKQRSMFYWFTLCIYGILPNYSYSLNCFTFFFVLQSGMKIDLIVTFWSTIYSKKWKKNSIIF